MTVIAVTRQSVCRDSQVAVTADQDSARAAEVTAVLIKRCRTVLTERCRYITNNQVANTHVGSRPGTTVTWPEWC